MAHFTRLRGENSTLIHPRLPEDSGSGCGGASILRMAFITWVAGESNSRSATVMFATVALSVSTIIRTNSVPYWAIMDVCTASSKFSNTHYAPPGLVPWTPPPPAKPFLFLNVLAQHDIPLLFQSHINLVLPAYKIECYCSALGVHSQSGIGISFSGNKRHEVLRSRLGEPKRRPISVNRCDVLRVGLKYKEMCTCQPLYSILAMTLLLIKALHSSAVEIHSGPVLPSGWL